jgi:hypothetical protein
VVFAEHRDRAAHEAETQLLHALAMGPRGPAAKDLDAGGDCAVGVVSGCYGRGKVDVGRVNDEVDIGHLLQFQQLSG